MYSSVHWCHFAGKANSTDVSLYNLFVPYNKKKIVMTELTKIVYILLATHIFYPFLAVEKNSFKFIRISMNYQLNHQGISFEHAILFFFLFFSMYILILFSDIL